MKPYKAPKLSEVVSTAIIIAHREDTTQLRDALSLEGFACEEIRGPYSDEQSDYPSQIRCLINHSHAWRRITLRRGYTLVVEADFVPVKGLAQLPLPFIPNPRKKALAWLYSVGPVIYHVDQPSGAIYGHNAGTVAYVIEDKVAKDWLILFEQDMNRPSPWEYRAWEVYLPVKLRRERGVLCYIPYKMYGEHGGLSNPEHKRNDIRSWHEADCLAGALHFLPAYARNNRWIYYLHRLRGRGRGFYRFLRGKYFDNWPGWYCSREDRLLRFRIALQRLL